MSLRALRLLAGSTLFAIACDPQSTGPGAEPPMDGSAVAQVSLPALLDVFEIGSDYILGRYLDPDEAVPQVHIYRLRR